MKRREYLLAIDGGGTKTEAIIANLDGTILGNGQSGKVNIHEDGISEREIRRNMRSAISAAVADAHLSSRMRFKKAVIGMAGIDSKRDVAIARKILERAWPSLPPTVTLVNDVFLARRAGSDLPYGLALIAGTGSNGYGVSRAGEEAWVGGIGHVASDDGSAYDIGRRVLQAAAKSADGRGPATSLQQMVMAHYGIASIREVEWPLHHQGLANKSAVAQLAPLADHAARGGDAAAKHILYGAADELVLMALTLVRKLALLRVPCECVCAGGVFHHNTIIWRRFVKGMTHKAPRLRCVRLAAKPVYGALRMAVE